MAQQTEKQARRVEAKFNKLLGPAWESHVWENLGWHVSWANGAVKLSYEHREKKFWAMIGDVGGPGGHLDFGGHSGGFENPFDAIAKACFDAREVYRETWLPIIASCETVLIGALKGK